MLVNMYHVNMKVRVELSWPRSQRVEYYTRITIVRPASDTGLTYRKIEVDYLRFCNCLPAVCREDLSTGDRYKNRSLYARIARGLIEHARDCAVMISQYK